MLVLYAFFSVYIEFLFQILIFGPSSAIIMPLCVAALIGGVFWCIYCYLPKKCSEIVSVAVFFLASLFSVVQLIYFRVFGSLMQLSLVRMTSNVFKNFGSTISLTVFQNIFAVIALFLPPILLVIIFCNENKIPVKIHEKLHGKLESLGIVLVCLLATLFFGLYAKNGSYSPIAIFRNSTSLEIAYQNTGILGGIVKDLGIANEETDLSSSIEIVTSGEYSSEDYNIQGIDFENLLASADKQELKDLDSYFTQIAPSKKNEYSGMLQGYNLISICAESFSPYLVSKELTPALYELSTNGFIFTNYYGSHQSVTSNGEYNMCTGLLPNMKNAHSATTFEDSIENYLPYCLGNALGSMGYSCTAFHNNIGEFYSRNLTHPNMGYDCKFAGSGLNIELTHPASDLEMFKQSIEYIDPTKPFHAYYMSYSGHQPYSADNYMAKVNYGAVKDLPYSETVKYYLSSCLDLEYALEYLMDWLKEEGIDQNTAIILTNDHYPYGLNEEQYNELAGTEIDTKIEKYRNSFICYVPNMQESKTVNEYCCTSDILPTVLNLFGIPFDSRLLAGRDILSDSLHVAILADGSFITDQFKYCTKDGKIPDSATQDSRGLTELDYQQYVNNLFEVSVRILDNNYYGHVFGVEGSDGKDKLLKYTDVVNTFHKAAIQYNNKYGLMDADADDFYGGERNATVGELLEACRRYASQLKISYDEKLISEGYDANAELYQIDCAVILSRFAKEINYYSQLEDIDIEKSKAEYPTFSEEELYAGIWASSKFVINAPMKTIYNNKDIKISRFQLAAYISYFGTRVIERF